MTIRMLATYDGFSPNDIITLDSALETALIAGGNASATLTGGVVAYRERQPVMIQPVTKRRGSVSLIANRKTTVPLTEGSALTITPTAGTTGTYQRYDATGAAVGALVTIGAAVLTVGAFEGDFTVEIKCTTGSLVAKTADAMVVDHETNAIGLAGPATSSKIDDAYRYAFSQLAVKAAPAIVETVPTATPVSRYYIDPIAGNDALAGTTPSTAWASLTKLNALSPGAGAVIHIAADAIFDYADDLATYKARSRFPYNGADSLRGSSSQPIIVKPYTVRPAATQKLPIVRWYATIAQGDWTQEAGIGPNIWSCAWNVNGFNTDNDIAVAFGPTKTLGVAPRQQVQGQAYGNSPQQLAKSMDYAFSANKLYVWSTGNPTLNYAGVYAFGLPVFCTSWQGLSEIKFTGIRFEFCRAFATLYGSNNLNAVTNFEVARCEFYRATLGYFANQSTNASPSEMSLSIHDNTFYETPFSGIRLGYITGTAGNTISWRVYRNRVYSGNLCSSLGGALFYNQAIGGTYHICWGNYGFDCRNGTGGNNVDGAMIYIESSSKNSIVYGNIGEQCAVPYHLNNSINALLLSNLAIDCNILAQVTGADDVNTPNQSYVIAHNTWLWTGRVADGALPVGPSGPKFLTGAVISQWNDNFGTFGNKFTSFAAVNNLAVSLSAGSTATKALITYILAGITTNLIAGNAAMGLSAVLSKDFNTDATRFTGQISASASAADIATWMRNAATGSARITPGSPIAGIGTSLSVQYQDIIGQNFLAQPTPGCFEAQA